MGMWNRRGFLRTVATGSGVAFAGCSAIEGEEPSTEEEAPPEFEGGDDDGVDDDTDPATADRTGTWRDWVLESDPQPDFRLFRHVDYEQIFAGFAADSDLYRGLRSRAEGVMDEFGVSRGEISFELEHQFYEFEPEIIGLQAMIFVGSFDGAAAAERYTTEIHDDLEIVGTREGYTIVEGEEEDLDHVWAFGDDAMISMLEDARYLDALLDGSRRIEVTHPSFSPLLDAIPETATMTDCYWLDDEHTASATVIGTHVPNGRIETREDEQAFIAAVFDSPDDASVDALFESWFPNIGSEEAVSDPDVSVEVDGRVARATGDFPLSFG